ncbi:MAG: DNA-binding protein [Planctomycetes bacterium]|nr:DNA-binding protein [Planctomycetota bacterium]
MNNQPVIEADPSLYHLPGFHEPFSAISHLFGAFVFLILGAILLVRSRDNPRGLIYLAVYSSSVVLLLAMSGVYHMMVRGGMAHQVFQRLDHCAIFFLIAGTFTPALGILLEGWMRWGPLVFIWAAAIAGVTLKSIFFENMAEWLGLSLYLAMGWFGIVSGVMIARRYGYNLVRPLLYGGIAYSVGALIDFLQFLVVIPGVVHPHEIFHVAVLMGAFWHWLFIWQFAAGDKKPIEP